MSVRPDIILVGASTGGPKVLLEMCRQLKHDLSPIIWINHIGQGSHVDVLVKHINAMGSLKAKVAEDQDIPTAGMIYCCPPRHHLTLNDRGSLRLSVRRGEPYLNCLPSVNLCFNSAAPLAKDKKILAIVATGMGTDGLEGARRLSQNGVQIITQAKESCAIYGMPKAVLDAGLSSHDLSTLDIVKFLNSPHQALSIRTKHFEKSWTGTDSLTQKLNVSKRNVTSERSKTQLPVQDSGRCSDPGSLSDSQPLSHHRSGKNLERFLHQFRELVVKETGNVTLEDRPTLFKNKLDKLMASEQCATLEELYKRCLQDPHLMSLLVGIMTIHETMFFRGRVPFEYLREQFFPEHQTQSKLRVWSSCCSTGQEVVSIVMSHEDFLMSHRVHQSIEVLGTDIDVTCIAHAEGGRYSSFQVSRGLHPHHLQTYFDTDASSKRYDVKDHLRSKMIYAHFNMLNPSYQKMGTFDLIFCNYSLIYFDLKHQKDIITKLAKNLNQNGILVLDPASALKVDHPQLKLISFNHHSFFRKVHDA